MADYEKINWQNGREGGTATSAANFGHMEDGIDAATKAAAAAQSVADGKADPTDIPDVSGFVTQADIDTAVDGLASASDIPDVSGLVTKADLDVVLERISALEAAAGDDGE